MASLKVEIWRKKPTPSTNIPLLLLRKSEQQYNSIKFFAFRPNNLNQHCTNKN